MNNQRRKFLSQASVIAGFAAFSKPLTSLADVSKRVYTLHTATDAVTIYHTNDLHGKIGAGYGEMGGFGHIKTLMDRQETSGLLFDAGDFLSGAQSLTRQQDVIRQMNKMNYHAVTLGNEELANGQDHLASLAPSMNFKMVNCNYTLNNALNKFVSPYIIVNSGRFKVGITGVGHKINGVIYNDAIESANKVAAMLKENEKCDLVICLSHLGYKQEGSIVDNQKLAKQSTHIDMIIGGHNRTLTSGPIVLQNKLKNEVILTHAAWDGLMLGRTIFNFQEGKSKSGLRSKYFIPGQPSGQSFIQSFVKIKATEKLA